MIDMSRVPLVSIPFGPLHFEAAPLNRGMQKWRAIGPRARCFGRACDGFGVDRKRPNIISKGHPQATTWSLVWGNVVPPAGEHRSGQMPCEQERTCRLLRAGGWVEFTWKRPLCSNEAELAGALALSNLRLLSFGHFRIELEGPAGEFWGHRAQCARHS